MDMIVAIIQPHRLEEVRTSLSNIGVEGMTVSEVKGYGRQKGHTEIYRGTEYAIHYVPKLKLEVAVASDMTNKVVEAITEAARQEKIGDGKIFVFDLKNTVRIRTGETGEDAL